MKLQNENLEQRLSLRLRRDLKREYEFRLFLDMNAEYGINKKEMIIQMYEMLLGNGFIDKDLRLRHSPMTNRVHIEEVIKQNEDNFKDSMNRESQRKVEEINEDDFNVIY